jgi:hypothetical protein
MVILRWTLYLLLSAVAGVLPVAPTETVVEALEDGEEALHGARQRHRVIASRDARSVDAQSARPRLAAVRTLRLTSEAGPESVTRPVRKVPSPGPEPGTSVDDH